MTNSVLSHCAPPAIDAREKRISPQVDDFAKLFANHADDFFIGSIENLLVARATNEAAKQSAIVWSAVWKLVMHERGCEHAFAFATRHKKTKARRQRCAHSAVVAEIDRNRRRELNAAEFGCESLIGHAEQ